MNADIKEIAVKALKAGALAALGVVAVETARVLEGEK